MARFGQGRRRRKQGIAHHTLREAVFRLLCRHRQGSKPNLLVYCTRRSGSTWLLNSLAAHPGMRHVNRPFLTVPFTRHRHLMPDLAEAAAYQGGDHVFRQVVHFEGDAERRFRALADKILNGEIEVYPALNFRASYFHRFTDRIVFQMTSGGPLIEWFDANFRVGTLIFVRHPIPNAFSIMERGWRPEYNDFLKHRWFVETQLEGAQVDFARRILAGRSLIAEHVLDWTLKMLVPLRAHASGRNPDWTLLTYEQLVLEPERMIDLVGRRHDLPEIQPMLAQVRRPSRTVSPNTKAKVSDPDFLLGRWRKRLASAEDEQELLRIPAAFGIEVYEPDRLTPREPYLWFGSS